MRYKVLKTSNPQQLSMKHSFENLVKVEKRLRKECPWDKKQDFESVKGNILDEAKEVIEAIEKKDYENLKEELGDLLHNILFVSNIAEEKDLFKIQEVVEGITEKLVRRHPHIFSDKKASTPEEVLKIWEETKKEEKRKKLTSS